jgi:hypothetical protein
MPPDIPGAIHHIPPRPGAHPSESMSGQSIGPKNNMLSFKQFLAQQDDSIDEGQAIQLYQEYKSDFKRKQITDFFDEHKEEDCIITTASSQQRSMHVAKTVPLFRSWPYYGHAIYH